MPQYPVHNREEAREVVAPDRATHQLIGARKASQTQEDTRQNSMMRAATH